MHLNKQLDIVPITKLLDFLLDLGSQKKILDCFNAFLEHHENTIETVNFQSA